MTPMLQRYKRHGYEILFGLTLALLAAVVAWWAVFIRTAIVQERAGTYETLRARIDGLAVTLGHARNTEPSPGPVTESLEVARCDGRGDSDLRRTLLPFWPDYCLQARAQELALIEEKFRRRTVMVVGESVFLLLLLLVSLFMLYRMILMERRVAREMDEFWSRMTHEIKTPITGVKAFLQTLKAQDIDRARLEPLLQLALRQVERQEMLMENLLVGRRMGRASAGPQLTRLDLAAYAADFLHTHRFLLGEARVSVGGRGRGEVFVRADPDALRVILENLTDNALKYGGHPLELAVTVEREGARGVLAFSDNGIGFEPSSTEVIFEAYRRLTGELPEGRHGTGMGLYLSRKLARGMGGDLQARSAGKGQGATFLLALQFTEQS